MNHLQPEKSSNSLHQDRPEVQCVFIHGWGMNRAVWQPFIEQLPDYIQPIYVDLSGHGQNQQRGFDDLNGLADQVWADVEFQLNGPAVWIGWSLGAMPVLQIAAQHPEWVQKLVLISANPCFVKQYDWPYAVDAAVFDEFAANLVADTEKTIQRFLSLQVQGSPTARDMLRQLRALILKQGLPTQQALQAGLELLKHEDLRGLVQRVQQPQYWLFGERDTLVPAGVSAVMQQQFGVSADVVAAAAHLPFVSHRDEILNRVIDFIHD